MVMAGTAQRSAWRTAAGPPAAIAVASRPSPAAAVRGSIAPASHCTSTDAAMVLFTAIHAKFVTKSTVATSAAPRWPSTARTATIDGTP